MTRKSLTRRRPGYTLMELLVATASASVLMAGMSSAVYIASQGLQIDEGSIAAGARSSRALDRLLADAREALAFSEQTATAITFTVPDRTEDGIPETIRYAWSGTPGDPLTYEINGSAPANLVEDVRQLDFEHVARTITQKAESIDASSATVYYQNFDDNNEPNNEDFLDIPTPDDVLENHLLIAAVAIQKGDEGLLEAPAGWTELYDLENGNNVTLGVWWKLASAAEPASHRFTWSKKESSYGWMMHFTGHLESDPIHASASYLGDSENPIAESVTTTVDRCLILRIGAFDEDDINIGDPGVADHQAITMQSSGAGGRDAASGGAAYEIQQTAGSTGTAQFTLTKKQKYLTVTIAIAPDPNGW